MEDRAPYPTGAAAPEPPLATADLVAAAHARRQGIPCETGEQWLERLPERLRALVAVILGGQLQGGEVAYAVAALIDMIESAPTDASLRWR